MLNSKPSKKVEIQIPSTAQKTPIQTSYKPERNVSTQTENPYLISVGDLERHMGSSRVLKGELRFQIFSGIVGFLAAFLYGTQMAYSSYFVLNEYMTHADLAWGTSLPALGCGVGHIIASSLNHHLGPRKTLLYLGFPSAFVMWTFKTRLNRPFLSQFITGIVMIHYKVSGETLLFNTSNIDMMRFLYAGFRVFIAVGYSVVFIFEKYYIYTLVTYVFGLHAYMLYISCESPVFLLKYGERKAEEAIIWFKGTKNIFTDMKWIRKEYDLTRVDELTFDFIFYSKIVIKATALLTILAMFRSLSGYMIFISVNQNFYSPRFSTKSDMSQNSQIIGCSIIFSKLLFTILHLKMHLPIKFLLTASSILIGINLILLAIFIYLKTYYDHKLLYEFYSTVLIVALLLSYDVGLGFGCDFLKYEYIPVQVIRKSVLIIEIVRYFFIFLIIRILMVFENNKLVWIFFLGLGCLNIVGAIFIKIFIVETRKKSFVQIQLKLNGNPVGNRSLVYVHYDSLKYNLHGYD